MLTYANAQVVLSVPISGLKLLVYEAVSYYCKGLKLLVYAALSY